MVLPAISITIGVINISTGVHMQLLISYAYVCVLQCLSIFAWILGYEWRGGDFTHPQIHVRTRDESYRTKYECRSHRPMSMPLMARDSLLSAVMVASRLALMCELPPAEASRDPEPSGKCGQLCTCEWDSCLYVKGNEAVSSA